MSQAFPGPSCPPQVEEPACYLKAMGSKSSAKRSEGYRGLKNWLMYHVNIRYFYHLSEEVLTNLAAKLATNKKVRRAALEATNPAAYLLTMARHAHIDDLRRRRGTVSLTEVHAAGLADPVVLEGKL